jgi:hypothetical protein
MQSYYSRATRLAYHESGEQSCDAASLIELTNPANLHEGIELIERCGQRYTATYPLCNHIEDRVMFTNMSDMKWGTTTGDDRSRVIEYSTSSWCCQ